MVLKWTNHNQNQSVTSDQSKSKVSQSGATNSYNFYHEIGKATNKWFIEEEVENQPKIILKWSHGSNVY